MTTSSTTTPLLSDVFDTDHYRARPTDNITWTPRRTTQPCDECAALQHQTRGAAGPRRPAKHRRTITPDNIALLLCHNHADAWRARDHHDTDR